ncbi:hypothetical protein EDB83DRAFT_907899 [Lactarius deliciosus]|nr:hypothetical protein EDB83DRAFT_907899 [Lactarius deliciosus]
MLKVAPVVRPRLLLSVLLSRWAAQLQVLQLTLARLGAPGIRKPFTRSASTAVLRRTDPSTCDVCRRTGIHFTQPGRSKTRRFQSAWLSLWRPENGVWPGLYSLARDGSRHASTRMRPPQHSGSVCLFQ